LRLDVTGTSARARNAHEEIAEAVVELLDVREYAHARMVLTLREAVHAVQDPAPNCTVESAYGLMQCVR